MIEINAIDTINKLLNFTKINTALIMNNNKEEHIIIFIESVKNLNSFCI